MKILVISASLRPQSRSRQMAQVAAEQFSQSGQTVEWLDLRDYPLPFCDGDAAYNHPSVSILSDKIGQANAIIVAVPIYNFDVNAAFKNLIELTGSAWEDRIVGFLCAAGGRSSYMSVMNIGNDLMLDFRCLIVPRFVYATGSDFQESVDGVTLTPSKEIIDRVMQLTQETVRLAKILE